MCHNSTSVFWRRKTPEQKKILSRQQSADREGGRKWNIHREIAFPARRSFPLIRLGPSLVSVLFLQAEVNARMLSWLKNAKNVFTSG